MNVYRLGQLSWLLLSSFLFCNVANAQSIGPKHATVPSRNGPKKVLDAVALNGAASTRTFTFGSVSPAVSGNHPAEGMATAIFWVDYTHANNGTLQFACTASHDDNATDYTVSTCSTASGKCTLNFPTSDIVFETPTLSGDKDFVFRWTMRGYRDLECSVTHSGTPSASDVLTLHLGFITE